MLRREFGDAWVYKTSDRWKSGIPDVLICREGRFFAVELKVGNNKATRIQLYVLEQIKRAGGRVAVCRSVDLRPSLRSGITRLREYSFTFLNRLNVPVGVSLCVVVWIRSGIYLLTKEVI